MLLDELTARFTYVPTTGQFVRKMTTSPNAMAGTVAGCKNRAGYVVIRVGGKKGRLFYAHRLAWLVFYGAEPPKGYDIDHVNGDKADNRIENLRLATRSQNNANRSAQSNNVSGHKGVYQVKRTNRWVVRIGVEGKEVHVGTYRTKQEAMDARRRAEIVHHKQFSRDNASCAFPL